MEPSSDVLAAVRLRHLGQHASPTHVVARVAAAGLDVRFRHGGSRWHDGDRATQDSAFPHGHAGLVDIGVERRRVGAHERPGRLGRPCPPDRQVPDRVSAPLTHRAGQHCAQRIVHHHEVTLRDLFTDRVLRPLHARYAQLALGRTRLRPLWEGAAQHRIENLRQAAQHLVERDLQRAGPHPTCVRSPQALRKRLRGSTTPRQAARAPHRAPTQHVDRALRRVIERTHVARARRHTEVLAHQAGHQRSSNCRRACCREY